jgi:Family of unknown function (DUF5677)
MSDETTLADNDETADRARQVISRLVRLFDQIVNTSIRANSDTETLFPLAFGWWARITRTSEAVARLYAGGFGNESAPLVRNIMQHTLALQWLIEGGEPALEAVYDYQESSFGNLIESARQAKWEPPPGIRAPLPPAQKDALFNQIKYFERMCALYEKQAGGMYALFRILSAYSHPTYHSASAYYKYDPESEKATLTNRSVVPGYRYIIQCAISLIHAGVSINGLLSDDPLLTELEWAANYLGITLELPRRKPTN